MRNMPACRSLFITFDPPQHIIDKGRACAGTLISRNPAIQILKRTLRFPGHRGGARNSDAVAKTVQRHIQNGFDLCQILVMLAGQQRQRAVILELHTDAVGLCRLQQTAPIMQQHQSHCFALLR